MPDRRERQSPSDRQEGVQEQERFLWLVRHGRAGEPSGTADRDRPLTTAGAADATALGRLLATGGLPFGGGSVPPPEVVISSPAVRTRWTAECLVAGLGRQLPVSEDATLYGAGPDAILTVVAGLDDSIRSAMVVGHNPGLYQTVVLVAGGGREGDVRARLADGGFPPCSLAVLQLGGGSWSDLASTGGAPGSSPPEIVALLRPPY